MLAAPSTGKHGNKFAVWEKEERKKWSHTHFTENQIGRNEEKLFVEIISRNYLSKVTPPNTLSHLQITKYFDQSFLEIISRPICMK